jgi:phosphoribosyl-ATP pyrophosphohydrolase
MIVPSIDLQDGQAVQLIGGRERKLSAGDPFAIAERFATVGTMAVVDLDAALGRGSNRVAIEQLCAQYPVRAGGGIRDEATARRWLDAGAEQIVIGTRAEPELLSKLPRERLVAALDCEHGEVVVEGWQRGTGRGVAERILELREHVAGFLVTFVEREGRCEGTAMERVAELVELAGDARVTIAGGVTTPEEVAELDRLGADAQVGMALYEGRMDLADAFCAPLASDRPDGLWPTMVCDERGLALGLVYSNPESVRTSIEERRGVYWSRTRGLWRKGETSGATQELVRVEADCDRDALRFVVRQAGSGFCHTGTDTCFGDVRGLAKLERTLAERAAGAVPKGSYTARLLAEPAFLAAKLAEEAGELAEAETPSEVRHEAADLLYFAAVAMSRAGVSLAEVERELDARARRVGRRGGEVKPTAEVPS